MSPGLLARARWHYGTVLPGTGGARVWIDINDLNGVPRHLRTHRRPLLTNGTYSTIRGMSALIPGPGGGVRV